MSSLADARAFLAADQADNRIRLFNPFAKDERKPTLWSYPPEDKEPTLTYRNKGSKFYKARWWQKVPFSY